MVCRSLYHKVLGLSARMCFAYTLEKLELSNNMNVFELWVKKITRTTKIHEKITFMDQMHSLWYSLYLYIKYFCAIIIIYMILGDYRGLN